MSNEEIIRRETVLSNQLKIFPDPMQYLVVGIDVGKEQTSCFYGYSNGKIFVQKSLSLKITLRAFSMLLETSNSIKSRNGLSKVVYGLEPTGNLS